MQSASHAAPLKQAARPIPFDPCFLLQKVFPNGYNMIIVPLDEKVMKQYD